MQLRGELVSRHRGDPSASFGADEFVRRVADTEGCGTEEARTHIEAVLSVLRESVTGGEFDDVLRQLPADIRALAGRERDAHRRHVPRRGPRV